MLQYLIIGGDGVIGIHLRRFFHQLHRPFIYTSRKKQLPDRNRLFLDLTHNIDDWHLPENIKAAFFCLAITSVQFCEDNSDRSRNVNVVNTIKIIDKLSQKNIPVVFLSSNQVFDGTCTYPDEKALTSPQTEYGRQKVQVEKEIEKSEVKHSIVRSTKIIPHNYRLFDHWISCLSRGRSVKAFADYFFSPVPIDIVGKVLIRIAEHSQGGVWHISGDRDISYYHAALLMAESIGADPSLVKRTSARDRLKNIYYPPSTALQCTRIKLNFGIHPPDVTTTIMTYNKP